MTKISAAALAPPAFGGPDRSRDLALLRRVTAGDVAALRTLYDAHAPRAMAIALRILNNVEEAEDVVQETFSSSGADPRNSRAATARLSPGS